MESSCTTYNLLKNRIEEQRTKNKEWRMKNFVLAFVWDSYQLIARGIFENIWCKTTEWTSKLAFFEIWSSWCVLVGYRTMSRGNRNREDENVSEYQKEKRKYRITQRKTRNRENKIAKSPGAHEFGPELAKWGIVIVCFEAFKYT